VIRGKENSGRLNPNPNPNRQIGLKSEQMNQRKGKRVARSPRRRARRRAGEKERKGTDFKSENQTLTLKRKPTWASTHRRQHRHRADRRPRRRSRTARGTGPRSALHLAKRSRQQGTTLRPLDGGVLSLGRARTPARGRWTVPPFFSLGH